MPITPTGFTALRSADYLATIKAAISAELVANGVSGDVNYARDGIFGVTTAVMATLLGDEGDTLQALADQWNVENAADAFADAQCALVGVYRQPATYSTVSLTVLGTGTLPAGSIARGSTGDWTTDEDVALPGAVAATCTVIGEVNAGANSITTMVSVVAGWTSVNNAAAAVPGQEIETTAALMVRRAESLQVSGRGPVQAIRGALLALTYLDAVVVVENDYAAAAGDGQPGHSIAVYVYPTGLTTDQGAEVAEAIYRNMSEGIQAWGTETFSVIGSDTIERFIEWSYAIEATVDVTVTITTTAAYVAGTAETAIAAYFAALVVGDDVFCLAIVVALSAVTGITGVPSVNLGDGAWNDYAIIANEIAIPGVVTIV